MTPLEKAARAGYMKHPTWRAGPDKLGDLAWDQLEQWKRDCLFDAMRAALEALMEPTEEMRAAGFEADAVHFGGTTPVIQIWQAMLRKVLEP